MFQKCEDCEVLERGSQHSHHQDLRLTKTTAHSAKANFIVTKDPNWPRTISALSVKCGYLEEPESSKTTRPWPLPGWCFLGKTNSEELFMSHQGVLGFPERGVDLWGGPGTSGRSGESLGKSWTFSQNLWIALQIHSERSPGEVIGELPGKFKEILRSPGTFQNLKNSDYPPATRQRCLQLIRISLQAAF